MTAPETLFTADALAALAVRVAALEAEVQALKAAPTRAAAPHWVRRIAITIADQWEVPLAQVLGSSRVTPLIRARFVLAWTVHNAGKFSYPQVARMVGYDDHTGVIHAVHRVNGWRATEPAFEHLTDHLLTIARRLRAEAFAADQAAAADAIIPEPEKTVAVAS